MTPNPSITTVPHDTQLKHHHSATWHPSITTMQHDTQHKYHHSATWHPTQASPQCHMTPKYHHSATWHPTQASPQCHMTPNTSITTVPHDTQHKYHHSATWHPTQASPYPTPAGRAATFAHNSVSRSCGDILGLDVTLEWQWRQRSDVEMAPQQHSNSPPDTGPTNGHVWEEGAVRMLSHRSERPFCTAEQSLAQSGHEPQWACLFLSEPQR